MRKIIIAAAVTLGLTPCYAMDYTYPFIGEAGINISASGKIEKNELDRFIDFNRQHGIKLEH